MIQKRQILQYTLLPGIFPRLRSLLGPGLFSIAQIICMLFVAVRLIPFQHPYMNEENKGKFGIRHVLSEASSNLKFSFRNLDQLVLYFMILCGLVMTIVQVVLVCIAVISQPVFAQSSSNMFEDYFQNPSPHAEFNSQGPEQDIAFRLLDDVFGMTGVFKSCVSQEGVMCRNMQNEIVQTPADYPYPMHKALHNMLGFYSLGIGMLALMIILYQIVNIVGETATTGTPFGQRYNHTWAPVRLIFFFALLAPLNIGGEAGTNPYINGAQYITFNAAKWGSNLATNGWIYFTDNLSENYIGAADKLIAKPNFPEFGYLLQFATVYHTCKQAYDRRYAEGHPLMEMPEVKVEGYLILSDYISETARDQSAKRMLEISFDKALEYSRNGSITVRFGHRIPDKRPADPDDKATSAEKKRIAAEQAEYDKIVARYSEFKGEVDPVCGEIMLPIGDISQPGARELAKLYYNMIRALIGIDTDTGLGIGSYMTEEAICIVNKHMPSFHSPASGCYKITDRGKAFVSRMYTEFEVMYEKRFDAAIEKQVNEMADLIDDVMRSKGWPVAATLYNEIAYMNGAVTTAIFNTPLISAYPSLMHEVQDYIASESIIVTGPERFNPAKAPIGGTPFKPDDSQDYRIAVSLYHAFKLFTDTDLDNTTHVQQTNNIAVDIINALFGTEGLFSMRDNADISPLAQLSALGKSMIEVSIRNFAISQGSRLAKVISDLVARKAGVGQTAGEIAGTIQTFTQTIATVTIVIGFMLFYILPFMPFMYFFFAMAGWIKSIFEAIVAMPLWALAHLAIDGQGLPGQAAANGYFLLFEIFLRPLLTFAGLIGSILAFSTMVNVLNGIFQIVTDNVTGGNPVDATPQELEFYRSAVDEFFFTFIYCVIVYMIALSTFKMIDMVPDNIMRWIGFGVGSFQDENKGGVDQLSGTLYQRSEMIIGQLTQDKKASNLAATQGG